MRNCSFPLLFIFAILCFSIAGDAANISASQSGNWSSTTTWLGGVVPGASDNVTIAGGYTVTVDDASRACSTLQLGASSNGDGTLSFASGSILTSSSTVTFGTTGGGARDGYVIMTNGGTFVCNNWVVNRGEFTYGTGSVEFTGAFNLPGAANFTKYNNLIINSSGSINMTAFLYVYGSLTMKGGIFSTGSGSGNGMYVYGDWNVTGGSFSAGSGAQCYVGFYGTTDQHIDASSFYYIYFYTSTGNAYLDGDITVKNEAGFWNSIVYGRYGATNAKLIFSDGAKASGVNSAAFFEGRCQKIGNDVFEFPIGKDGQYAPLGITNPSSVGDAFTAEYFNEAYSSLSSKEATIDHVASNQYWVMDYSGSGTNVKVDLIWRNGWCGINDLATLVVTRWDGAIWRYHSAATGGNINNGDAQTSSTVAFANGNSFPFTLGSTSSATNPMPVELMSFEAVTSGHSVNLSWKTSSEFNADYFAVERSVDGYAFSEIARQTASGTSSTIHEYSAVDTDPVKGLSFYRLRQTDFNGEVYYSKMIPVQFSAAGDFTLQVFQNSASSVDDVLIALTGEPGSRVQLHVSNVMGQELGSQDLVLENGSAMLRPASFPSLTSGVYIITAASNDILHSQRMVIR